MREKEIDAYAALMKKWGLSRISVQEEGALIQLERCPQGAPSQEMTGNQTGNQAAAAFVPAAAQREEGGGAAPERVSVTSPMVGVFYASPAENSDPYVSEGDRVKRGQILCIIEAMKLMNEIRAESDGVIARICVTNGQVVEYGTALFELVPEGNGADQESGTEDAAGAEKRRRGAGRG